MNATNNKEDLEVMDFPYAERQLIVIQADDVVYAARDKENQRSDEGSVDWKKFATYTTFGLAGVAGYEVYKYYKNRESGINILNITHSESLKLTFPPGHPRKKVLYVAHPGLLPAYYTAASFHRMVFEHKCEEVIRLLMSLGARNIRVKHERGWSREFSSVLSASIPESAMEKNVTYSDSKGQSLMFEACFENNNCRPSLPSGLVWYPHEPTWKVVAEGRLNHGLSKFSLSINYSDDYGINVSLKANAETCGLSVGGEFQEHKSTTWLVEGEFNDF